MGSPIEVALNGFEGTHARLVAWSASDDDAFVLLDVNATGRRYLYGINCHRHHEKWEEGNSGNGPGWSRRSLDEPGGTLAFWGETSLNADRARIMLDGVLTEVPVIEGVYLATWWKVPAEVQGFPFVTSFRVDGVWSDSTSG